MRIHTSDKITKSVIERAVLPIEQVYIGELSAHGSRSHHHAFDVQLRGSGARHTRRPNSGQRGADDGYAATYADWGFFLAALYRIDPSMKAGPYVSADEFHRITEQHFVKPLPQVGVTA